MNHFDSMKGLFVGLGLSEEAATVAACGREYRGEGEARAAESAFEAEDLADNAFLESQSRRGSELQEIQRTFERTLAELPQVAANAAMAALGRPAANPPVTLSPASEAAVPAVRDVLGKSEAAARQYVADHHAREVKRGGTAHADSFIRAFAASLRAQVREVAPR